MEHWATAVLEETASYADILYAIQYGELTQKQLDRIADLCNMANNVKDGKASRVEQSELYTSYVLEHVSKV